LLRLLGLAVPAGTVIGALLSTAGSTTGTTEAVTNIVIVEAALVIACARILLVIGLVSIAAWCGGFENTLPHLLGLVNVRVVLLMLVLLMLVGPALLRGLGC